jgi:hypothetical protein
MCIVDGFITSTKDSEDIRVMKEKYNTNIESKKYNNPESNCLETPSELCLKGVCKGCESLLKSLRRYNRN